MKKALHVIVVSRLLLVQDDWLLDSCLKIVVGSIVRSCIWPSRSCIWTPEQKRSLLVSWIGSTSLDFYAPLSYVCSRSLQAYPS